MKKKPLKIIALIIAVVLIAGLCVFANSLIGNPISRMMAEKTAEKYLNEEYGETDYYIDSIDFSFKDGKYYAHIKSPSSIDTYFTLYICMDGKLKSDTYSDVLDGSNTVRRLNEAYRKLTDSVLESPSFPYTSEIAFGDLEFISCEWIDMNDLPAYALIQEDLELDKSYDIPKLGAEAGHLIIYVDDETVSVERAAEILLDIKSLMDEGGVTFYAMDFVLQYPRTEPNDSRPEGSIHIRNFLYADIYEENLIERIKAAHEATIAYYAERDAQKLNEQEN